MSFVEIVLASVLLILIVVPLGMLLSQSQTETRVSIDEFYASLYLTELLDQAGSLAFEDLPVRKEPYLLHDGGDPKRLDAGRPRTAMHLAKMRSQFSERQLVVKDVPASGKALKELRAKVVYERPRGVKHSVEMLTYVGRGR